MRNKIVYYNVPKEETIRHMPKVSFSLAFLALKPHSNSKTIYQTVFASTRVVFSAMACARYVKTFKNYAMLFVVRFVAVRLLWVWDMFKKERNV